MTREEILKAIENNEGKLVDDLAELLWEFAKNMRPYQTDVYLYLDEEGKPYLDTFVNVGGNSWLNDDHLVIYRDEEHHDSIFEPWDNIGDLADAVKMTKEELVAKVRADREICEDEDVEFWDCTQYIKDHDNLMDELQASYEEILNEYSGDFRDQAQDIVDRVYDNVKGGWYGNLD